MSEKGKDSGALRSFLETCYPPGYECWQEWTAACILLGMGVLFSFRFFYRLWSAEEQMRQTFEGFRISGEGLEAEAFAGMVCQDLVFFVPLPLFLTAMVVYHYLYYFSKTKSIYLMRRLPRRGAVARSCILGPLLCLGIGGLCVAGLYLLYYVIYLLVIPLAYMPRLY